ncbi:hypothetical protein C8F01DRAFT_1076864 [Mycena amicta]|nr:hypothetical protein C8F01DRAFT_1076864 [Mycena amicta]
MYFDGQRSRGSPRTEISGILGQIVEISLISFAPDLGHSGLFSVDLGQTAQVRFEQYIDGQYIRIKSGTLVPSTVHSIHHRCFALVFLPRFDGGGCTAGVDTAVDDGARVRLRVGRQSIRVGERRGRGRVGRELGVAEWASKSLRLTNTSSGGQPSANIHLYTEFVVVGRHDERRAGFRVGLDGGNLVRLWEEVMNRPDTPPPIAAALQLPEGGREFVVGWRVKVISWDRTIQRSLNVLRVDQASKSSPKVGFSTHQMAESARNLNTATTSTSTRGDRRVEASLRVNIVALASMRRPARGLGREPLTWVPVWPMEEDDIDARTPETPSVRRRRGVLGRHCDAFGALGRRQGGGTEERRGD